MGMNLSFIKKSKKALFFVGILFFISPTVFGAMPIPASTLRLGDYGDDVLALQKILNLDKDTVVSLTGAGSPGQETRSFGPLTKQAVIRFQEKYKSEILTPSGLLIGSGFVGQNTLLKLRKIAFDPDSVNVKIVNQPVNQKVTNNNPITPKVIVKSIPSIFSVFPNRVRRGDKVTIIGENFTKTGNNVVLGDGSIKQYFYNLSSEDEKTLSFIYKPPEVRGMNEKEIRTLPNSVVNQIEDPIKAVGKRLSDALVSYENQGITNEPELKAFLEKNGHSFEEMYHHFFVILKNDKGATMSQEPILFGLRAFSFENLAKNETSSRFSFLGEKMSNFFGRIFPVADAQGGQSGGGFFATVMMCTCGSGFLNFAMDYGESGGSGLYYFSPGFMPDAGTGMGSGMWLGGFQQSGGSCVIGVSPYCVTITANTPQKPWGSSI